MDCYQQVHEPARENRLTNAGQLRNRRAENALVTYGWPQQLDQLADLQFLMFILAVTGLILGGSSDERAEAKRRAEEKQESLRLILARESTALMQRACAPSSIQLRSARSDLLVRATCLENTFILSATTPARAGRASADRARLFLPVRSPSSQTEFRGHCGQCVAKYTT
jgi:hypothetical protein